MTLKPEKTEDAADEFGFERGVIHPPPPNSTPETKKKKEKKTGTHRGEANPNSKLVTSLGKGLLPPPPPPNPKLVRGLGGRGGGAEVE